jgi:hypothetical protein
MRSRFVIAIVVLKALPVQRWLDNGVVALGWEDVRQSLWCTLYDTESKRFI